MPRPDVSNMRVLIVDDSAANVTVLAQVLERGGYTNVVSVRDPLRTRDLCVSWSPDLLLLDLHMPRMDGFEVLAGLADQLADPVNLPVIVLTADVTPSARNRALREGAQDFLVKPFDHTEVLLRIRNQLETRALQQQLREHNTQLADAVRTRTHELEQARLETLSVLAGATEYRDDDTHEHTRRVGRTAALLGRELGLDDETVATLLDAAPLHDIGKLGISDTILLKPGRLTDEERSAMQRHVEIGGAILASVRSPVLRMAGEIARSHHERWDGKGYLLGLRGEQIPLSARITAVADVFDALTHDRPYKRAWPLEQAVAAIAEGAGTQFDPRVAAAFGALDHERLLAGTRPPRP